MLWDGRINVVLNIYYLHWIQTNYSSIDRDMTIFFIQLLVSAKNTVDSIIYYVACFGVVSSTETS